VVLRHLADFAVRIPAGEARPGDIALVRWAGQAIHLGVLIPGAYVVHSMAGAGVIRSAVAELDLAAWYRFREL
jgi:hypothetical protein